MKHRHSWAILLGILASSYLALSHLARAEESKVPLPVEPAIAPASEEAEQAMLGIKIPAGLEVSLVAAEPLMANPVAFHIDGRGRIYVCESFRQANGVLDNRAQSEAWVDDDLAAQTVDDRRAYILKHLGDKSSELTEQDDRVRLLLDTNGDGRMDRSTVFANRFNDIVSGTGAGVLAHNGNVYYTCIPDLWLLRDNDGDGKAEIRKSLHYGFGVRTAFHGHDLHGLTMGPDGRLYFSIADRGYHIQTEGQQISDPESGAVFRCELDGSKLEVVHTGLRNPQELAFDDFGNLFTCDNNSDYHDHSRWTSIVEGGDSGWRLSYQYQSGRSPFHREELWKPYTKDQAAYIVPPITNITHGPSGLAYYPGTGLSQENRGCFLLCDFRGGPAGSSIRRFRMQPKGATFELMDRERYIQNILATDVDFGPDGSIYICDWVHGWEGLGKGRIYKLTDPKQAKSQLVQQVKSLLATGVARHASSKLISLLSHQDKRVRQMAQFELANRRETRLLKYVSQTSDSQMARIHAIWALGQLTRSDRSIQLTDSFLLALLQDQDDEIRSKAATLIAETNSTSLVDALIERLKDSSLRVRYFAAMSLSHLGDDRAVAPVIEMLAENADRDPMLRHSGIRVLTVLADDSVLHQAAKHKSPAVRIATVVAFRKQSNPLVAELLHDSQSGIVDEAARAIHDTPILAALPQLADLIKQDQTSDVLLRRVLNANYRLGQASHANALAAFAAKKTAPEAMRIEALRMLAAWGSPSSRDRVLGMWRPLPSRDPSVAVKALKQSLSGILASPEAVQSEGIKIGAQLAIREVGPTVHRRLSDKSRSGKARGEAIQVLALLDIGQISASLPTLLADDEPHVRIAARRVLAKVDPGLAIKELGHALKSDVTIERQSALAITATLAHPDSKILITKAFDRMLSGDLPVDTHLDVLMAASKNKAPVVQRRLTAYQQRLPSGDPLASYQKTLHGGNAERGQEIFFNHGSASCIRCHRVGRRGGRVGPDLSKISIERKRDYLLESLVEPDRQIAKGYALTTIITDEGKILSGIVQEETEKIVKLMTPAEEIIEINKSEIDDREQGLSAMPADLLKQLSKSDVRDLIEYLSTLK